MIRNSKNLGHLFEARLATTFFGNPASKMVVIGVTGTDGKTTTSSLIYHILKKCGKKAALINTLGVKISDIMLETGPHTTTPSSFYLQKYIKKAYNSGVKYLAIEATSHALDQNRVSGIPFEIGVLTNITHEHLDYHITHDKYLESKLKLFKQSKNCVLNMDDLSFLILKAKLKDKKIYSYSLKNQSADTKINDIKFDWDDIADFNRENYLAAITACKILGIEMHDIINALPSFVLPQGRQEKVYDNGFKVIIDFAHTPNSFEQVLKDISAKTKGRLIHVFGAAGGRDSSKRGIMGKYSDKFANLIILTAEDSRNEKVGDINNDIKKGIKNKIVIEIENRRLAIEKAIDMAKENDTILITGKGHEKSMNLGRGEIPWSDHEAVVSAIEKRADLQKAQIS